MRNTLTLRIATLLIVITFFFIYMEWGQNQKSFVFEMLDDIFSKQDMSNKATHPIILLPLFGLIGLLLSTLKNRFSPLLFWTSAALIAVLVLLVFAIGLMSLKLKILAAPTIILGLLIFILIYYKRHKNHFRQGDI